MDKDDSVNINESNERPPRMAVDFNNERQMNMHPALLEMKRKQKSMSSKSNERIPRHSSKSNPRKNEDQSIQLKNMRN